MAEADNDTMNEEEEQHVRRLIRQERAGKQAPIEIGPHSAVVLSWVVRWASVRPQLVEWSPALFGAIERQLDALLADDPDGEALRRRRQPVTLNIGPYSAFLLIGAIDWWLRQPGHQESGPVFLDPVAEQLIGLLAEEPIVLEMVHRARTREK